MIYFLFFKTNLRFSLPTLQQHTTQICANVMFYCCKYVCTSYLVNTVLEKFKAGNTVHMHQLTCSSLPGRAVAFKIHLNIEIFILKIIQQHNSVL